MSSPPALNPEAQVVHDALLDLIVACGSYSLRSVEEARRALTEDMGEMLEGIRNLLITSTSHGLSDPEMVSARQQAKLILRRYSA